MALVHRSFKRITIHTAKCDGCNKNRKAVVYRCNECSRQLCIPCRHKKGGDETHTIDEGDTDYEGLLSQSPGPDTDLVRPTTAPSRSRQPESEQRAVVVEDSEEDNTASSEPPRKRRKETRTRNSSEEDNEVVCTESSRKRKRGTHTIESSEDDEETAHAESSRKKRKVTHPTEGNAGYNEVNETTTVGPCHLNVRYSHLVSITEMSNDSAGGSIRRRTGRKGTTSPRRQRHCTYGRP